MGPDPHRIAGNERLRKNDQVGAFGSGFLDQRAGFLHPGVAVEKR